MSLKKFKDKVAYQASLIFGVGDRRRNRPKRQFLDSVIDGQKTLDKNGKLVDREVAAEIVTYTVARFREYYMALKKENPSYGANEFITILFEE